MLRKFFGAALVLVLVVGMASAETVRGLITAVSDKEITVTPFKGKEKGDETKYDVSDKTKVFKMTGKDTKDDSNLKELKKAVEGSTGKFKGAFATIEVDGKKATEISFRVFKIKPKKDAAE